MVYTKTQNNVIHHDKCDRLYTFAKMSSILQQINGREQM